MDPVWLPKERRDVVAEKILEVMAIAFAIPSIVTLLG